MLTFVVIFVILWWLILFLILPIGVKKEQSVEFGNDPGAPNNPMLKKKILNYYNNSAYFNIDNNNYKT